uniref:Ig-like domain-containing protein n=1 Tax=Cyanistes caeruleus TaxID=156563 RepID=A0A8C0ZAY4_CYACU
MTPSAPPNLCVPPVLHSLHYLDVAVSEPSPGVPQFMSLGFMDGIPFTRYDSERGQVELLMQWMEDGAEPGYWESQTQIAVRNQHLDARNLETLQHRYNQSGGLHTSQWLYGCDLLDNGSVRGSSRYRYDGWDFISFKLRYKSFALERKRERGWGLENYLKHVFPEWFRKYFRYGQKELERKVVPDVHVSRKEEHGTLILSCHVYGFYPNTTAVSWMKGSEIRDQKMEWGGIVPNSDGTFHTWARIEALPEEWEQYRCQVEHPGMLEPGIFTWGPFPPLLNPGHFRSLLFPKKHSGKGSAAGQMVREWAGGHLMGEAVIVWGDAWPPHNQRADWVKGHINSNTAVAGSQCVLGLV